MRTNDLDYHLPEAQIAQHPLAQRDAARMLVVDRAAGTWHEDIFRNLPDYLRPGDCLTLNDTRVVRARLRANKDTGGAVELFLLRELAPGEWAALVRPSAKVKVGAHVQLAGGAATATVGERLPNGQRRVRFDTPDVLRVMEAAGEIPLPPYIHREEQDPGDLTRYQTVYAAREGAVAAPTAGLHYTPEVFAALDAKGVGRARLTLHVGYGTFKPVTVDDLAEHRVDPEWFDFPAATADALNTARAAGGRVVAVGTTATRVLETQHQGGRFVPGTGETSTYICPPYDFRGVDVLQTNFHLPKSSLLALVAAFTGPELALAAYRHAVSANFRFYSYGDVMLIV